MMIKHKGTEAQGENPGQTGDYLVFVLKNQVITGLTRISVSLSSTRTAGQTPNLESP